MKKKDIEVGKVYACKVSGKIVPVKIFHEYKNIGGWDADNLATDRPIRIKAAARLLYPMVWSKSQQKYIAAPIFPSMRGTAEQEPNDA